MTAWLDTDIQWVSSPPIYLRNGANLEVTTQNGYPCANDDSTFESRSIALPNLFDGAHVLNKYDFYIRVRIKRDSNIKFSGLSLDKNTIPLVMIIGGNIDTTPPTITLIGSSIVNVPVGTEFNDPGALTIDNIDSSVTVETSGGTVDITEIRFKYINIQSN